MPDLGATTVALAPCDRIVTGYVEIPLRSRQVVPGRPVISHRGRVVYASRVHLLRRGAGAPPPDRESLRAGPLSDPRHLRVDVDLSRPGGVSMPATARGRAKELGGMPLEVAVFVPGTAEAGLAKVFEATRSDLARWSMRHALARIDADRPSGSEGEG